MVPENASGESSWVYSCADAGLPVTPAGLGINTINGEILHAVAETAFHNLIHTEPKIITGDIKSAIPTTNSIGRHIRAGGKFRLKRNMAGDRPYVITY